MARVIVVLGLMIAITATMFWITRRPPVAEGVAATPAQPAATVSLAELNSPKTPGADDDIADKPEEASHSPESAGPRDVTNLTGAQGTVPASAQDLTARPVAGAAPSIGTAGIDQKNNASFTGTATPGDAVSLLWDNKPIGWTTTDASGNWSLEFKAPVSGREHEMMVTAQAKDGTVVIGPQRATIGPSDVAGGLPRITLMAAGEKGNAVDPGGAAAEPSTGLIVEKIVNGQDGEATLTGQADAGATVRVIINGKPAGEALAAPDGAWSMSAINASGKNAASMKLELINAGGAKIDEAELPFKIAAAPSKLAAAGSAVKTDFPSVLTSKPAKGAAAAAVDAFNITATEKPVVHDKPKYRVIKVRRGDSLWRISKRHLGNGKKWARFYRLNKRKIDNPDLIFPGQTLILPG
jgi:nucleoid-associated protein YgaU